MVGTSCLLHYSLCNLSLSLWTFLFSSVQLDVISTSHELAASVAFYRYSPPTVYILFCTFFSLQRHVVFFGASASISRLPSRLPFLKLTAAALICRCLDPCIDKRRKRKKKGYAYRPAQNIPSLSLSNSLSLSLYIYIYI